MTPHEQPAGHGRGGLSEVVRSFPAERLQDSHKTLSRQHEIQAHRCAMAALSLRGADAFAQAALAGFHARAAVALMTGAQHV